LRVYASPLKAFSRILDEGRLLTAVLLAAATAVLLQAPQVILMHQAMGVYADMLQKKQASPSSSAEPASSADGSEEEDDSEADLPPSPPAIEIAIDKFTVKQAFIYPPWTALLALAFCFAPGAILILTMAEGWRSFCSILYRDYLALLMCFLTAWTAAYLPLSLLNLAQLKLGVLIVAHPYVGWVAHLYFLSLAAFAIRTIAGTNFRIAIGATAGGWAGAIGGIMLGGVVGYIGYWILSPCLLYALWARVQGETLAIGSGLRRRQAMKRQLEIATINPRDADAHCQLGLICLERHQPEAAMERFRAAVEIDPEEPDARYHLGRLLRQQGQQEAALENLRISARIDDKHALNEVWREIGAAAFLSGRLEESLAALEKFLERRPYDPEGRCWYGRLLVQLSRHAAAERAFCDAIEAVRTMPPARRRQVQEWDGQAGKELRALRNSLAQSGAGVSAPLKPKIATEPGVSE
jgi:tetratricopeptide (TPR) repeat protein